MTKQFILDRIHSRGITTKDDNDYGKSFGYLAYPHFSLKTEEGLETEKQLARKWNMGGS